MAHGDTRVGKWRGNWRMQWVASTLHTTSEHVLSSITTADAHTSAASSRLNWRPCRFKWTRPFRPKDEIWFLRVCHHISTGPYSLNFILLCSNPLRAWKTLRSFLSLLLNVRTCWDCLNLNMKPRPSYRISMLPIWQGINASIFLIINLWKWFCCRESTGHPANTSATPINNGWIVLWRQWVVTQIEIFLFSEQHSCCICVCDFNFNAKGY